MGRSLGQRSLSSKVIVRCINYNNTYRNNSSSKNDTNTMHKTSKDKKYKQTQPLYGHYQVNLCLLVFPAKNWRILLEQRFTTCMSLLTETNEHGLGKDVGIFLNSITHTVFLFHPKIRSRPTQKVV